MGKGPGAGGADRLGAGRRPPAVAGGRIRRAHGQARGPRRALEASWRPCRLPETQAHDDEGVCRDDRDSLWTPDPRACPAYRVRIAGPGERSVFHTPTRCGGGPSLRPPPAPPVPCPPRPPQPAAARRPPGAGRGAAAGRWPPPPGPHDIPHLSVPRSCSTALQTTSAVDESWKEIFISPGVPGSETSPPERLHPTADGRRFGLPHERSRHQSI